CHPGYAATELQYVAARMDRSTLMETLFALGNRLLAQDAAAGALPALYAAAAADVAGGDYVGPDGLGELWGAPTKVSSSGRSHDAETAARLWSMSEELTGVRYDALAG